MTDWRLVNRLTTYIRPLPRHLRGEQNGVEQREAGHCLTTFGIVHWVLPDAPLHPPAREVICMITVSYSTPPSVKASRFIMHWERISLKIESQFFLFLFLHESSHLRTAFLC